MKHFVIIIKLGLQLLIPVTDEKVDKADTLVWDTRIDGPLTPGLDYEVVSRSNTIPPSLFLDNEKVQQKANRISQKEAEENLKRAEKETKQARITELENKLQSPLMSVEEIKEYLFLKKAE